MTTADFTGPGKTDCTLAIDLGTSGPKVALVSVQGEVLACEIEKTPVMLLPGGGAEQEKGGSSIPDNGAETADQTTVDTGGDRSEKPAHEGPTQNG